jgi:hypothetical protein
LPFGHDVHERERLLHGDRLLRRERLRLPHPLNLR